MIKHLVVRIINVYQCTLSPDTGWFKYRNPGGYCKYEPHCSEYGKQAILKYGVIKGGVMAIWRVLRCNPLSKGGFDPVG